MPWVTPKLLFSWAASNALKAKAYLREWFIRDPLQFLDAWTPDDSIDLFDNSINSTAELM